MKKYTAEQIEGEVADMSAEGYPDGLRTNMLRAFAATLRQQAERGDVAVSAWREEWAGSDPGRGWYIRESTGINGRVVAYLGENIASELVREVIAAHNASLFIGKPEECADACPPQQVCDYCQAVAPILRAPVELGGRVDELEDALFQIAVRLGETRESDMDDMSWHTQLIARAQYLANVEQAALAQNAQAVDVVAMMEHLPDNRAATRAELIRAMALTRAGQGGQP